MDPEFIVVDIEQRLLFILLPWSTPNLSEISWCYWQLVKPWSKIN